MHSNNCSEPDDFDWTRDGPNGDKVGAGVEMSELPRRHAPRNARVSSPRTVGHLAATGIAVDAPRENRREEVETTNGDMSKCRGFGDKIKRWVSRLPLGKLKILVVVCQILAGFSSITAVGFPASYSRFLTWINVVNLDMGDIFSASCVLPSLNFDVRLLSSTPTPLMLAAALVLTYHMAKRRAGLGRAGVIAKRDAWSRHVAAGFLFTFVVSFKCHLLL